MTADRLPPSPRIEDLIEHASWLRGLAGALVRDAATADDLVQDTWLAAMRKPRPRHVAPRAWLTGIARNLAKMGFRGGSRRARREQAAAADEALPGAEELVERLETQRRLASLVAQLREPVRSIVLLRFYEGLDSNEIARRRGEPSGTVRWRLKQGLDELRTRLDAAHGGDRGRWTVAFAPLAAPRGGGSGGLSQTVAAAGAGGVLMASTTKLVAAGAVSILLLAGGAWWAGRSAAADRRPAGVSRMSSAAQLAEGLTASTSPRDRRPSRLRGASAPAPEAATAVAVASNTPSTRVVGRVVDPAGAVLATATVRVGFFGAERRVADDGRFSVEVALAGETCDATLQFAAPGRAIRVFGKNVERGVTTDLGDVTLAEGGVVSGRVVDDAGIAVAGAAIVLSSVPVESADAPRPRGRPAAPAPELRFGPDSTPMSMLDPSPRGPTFVSDATGAFTLHGVPTGEPTMLRVVATGHRRASQSVTAWADAPIEGVRIVLARQKENEGIEGRVVAPDGTPACGAFLLVDFDGDAIRGNSPGTADSEGGFHFETIEGTTYGVRVVDAERGWTSDRVGGLVAGRRDVVVQAQTARRLEIVARGEGGVDVPAFAYKIAADGGPTALDIEGFVAATPEKPARFLAPGGRFAVVVAAAGFVTATVERLDAATAGDRVVVTLEPSPTWRGVVRSRAGPVAGAKVTLHAVVAAGSQMFSKGFPLTRMPTASAAAVARDDGAFELTVREPGRYFVRAEAPGFACGETPALDLDPTSGGVLPTIELGRGGAIEGVVKTGGARNPEGLLVCATRGDGVVLDAKVGADGRWRFDGLAAGPWIVRVVQSVPTDESLIIVASPDAPPIEWSCEVREGETTRRDLAFGAGASCAIRGRLAAPGEAKWFVGLDYADVARGSTDDKYVPVGADGAYEMFTDRTGAYFLTFSTEHGELRVLVPVQLGEGERRVDLALRLGNVEVMASTSTSRMVVWEGETGAFATICLRRAENGKAVAPMVPAGRARIVRFDPASKVTDPRTWPVDAEIDVPAGGTRVVELR